MTYQIGQTVEGKITGIQPYGAFVSLDRNTSGLIHISEISDGYVRDISRFVNVGDIRLGKDDPLIKPVKILELEHLTRVNALFSDGK